VNRVLYAPRELPPLPPDVSHDDAYASWVQQREELRIRSRAAATHEELALVMIAGHLPSTMTEQTLRSLRRQTSSRWTLTITGTTASLREVDALVRACLPRHLRGRIRPLAFTPGTAARDLLHKGVAANDGHAVALVFPGDIWAPDAVAILGSTVSDTSVLYADDDQVTTSGIHHAPRFKPDFSPDFLLSSAYIGRPLAMGSEVARHLPTLIADDPIALEHECALAACEIADSVDHIAEVLCHRSEIGDHGPAGPSAVDYICAALGRRAEPAEVTVGPIPGTFHIRRPATSGETVSILVPFRDEPRLLRTCVDSVTATTRSHDIELVLIDNGSSDPEVLTLLEHLDTRDDVRVISDPRPFNWAQLNNTGARIAGGDVLLFLNNDIEAHREGWLSALVGHALRTDVGAVGARLVYPDRRLQHCGVVVGLIGAAGHPLIGLESGEGGYMNMALATRECSAVTGACLASRREVFNLLNGFDESLGVDLNDVDYCLRALAAGYRTVYEPAAELVHHESPSRGTAGGIDDILNFIARWKDYISAGDPYFNVHLTRTSVSCGLASSEEGDRWNQWHSALVDR